MPDVACVLLDHVRKDPSQVGRLTAWPGERGWPVQAALGDGLGDQRARARYSVLPQGHQLLRAVVGGRLPVPVRIGVPVHRVPWLVAVPAVQLDREPVVLYERQVLEQAA